MRHHPTAVYGIEGEAELVESIVQVLRRSPIEVNQLSSTFAARFNQVVRCSSISPFGAERRNDGSFKKWLLNCGFEVGPLFDRNRSLVTLPRTSQEQELDVAMEYLREGQQSWHRRTGRSYRGGKNRGPGAAPLCSVVMAGPSPAQVRGQVHKPPGRVIQEGYEAWGNKACRPSRWEVKVPGPIEQETLTGAGAPGGAAAGASADAFPDNSQEQKEQEILQFATRQCAEVAEMDQDFQEVVETEPEAEDQGQESLQEAPVVGKPDVAEAVQCSHLEERSEDETLWIQVGSPALADDNDSEEGFCLVNDQ